MIVLMAETAGAIYFIAAAEHWEHYQQLLLDEGQLTAREVSISVQRLLSLWLYLNEFHNFSAYLHVVVQNQPKVLQIIVTVTQNLIHYLGGGLGDSLGLVGS